MATSVQFRPHSQNARLLAWLEAGHSITSVIATDQFKIRSLTRRIRDLRDAGVEVESEWKQDANGAWYTEYWIQC